MLYYDNSTEELLKHFEVNPDEGLTDAEVEARRKEYGWNELKVETMPLWRKIVEPFLNIFILILLGAMVISLLHGGLLDAMIILAIVTVNVSIHYAQQISSDRILKSLREKSIEKVLVVRNGEHSHIEAGELVPGDIVLMSEGEKVPADGRVLDDSGVRVNESMLTGESAGVNKSSRRLSGEKEVYEQSNLLFSGTFLLAGEARMLVIRTGNATEYGKIAGLATEVQVECPVQQKINKLISQIAIVIGLMAILVIGLSLWRGTSLIDSIQFAIAMAVSAVPEGLPVAISVILVLGMRRMAKKKALVTNMRAIETIGVITTIATDKTGTLTENRLSVQKTWKPHWINADIGRAIAAASLTNANVSDPLDTAMMEYTKEHHKSFAGSELLRSFPFNQKLAMSGNLWRKGEELRLCIKGSPEHLLDRSGLTVEQKEDVTNALNELTSYGYRVIAVGEISIAHEISSLEKVPASHRVEITGLMAVADTLRPESKTAVAAAKRAGVTVRMITGDHHETAFQIGQELGIVETREEVFDSRRIEFLDEEELREIIARSRVFARVTPEAKYKILEILKKDEIAAMTGDGVNDVPALANAHIGISMGSGPRVVKDAGDIVLLDDNFKNIVTAMAEGRVVIANIKRMLVYLLATNAGEAVTMIGALILGSQPPLVAVQILWVNLVTDTMMVIPLGLEKAEDNVMRQQPKAANAPLLSANMKVRMVLVATTMATMTLSIYMYFENRLGHAAASTLAFATMVVAQWANALNMRSNFQSMFKRLKVINRPFYFMMFIAVTLQMLVLFTPLGGFLHVDMTDVPLETLLAVMAIAFVIPIAVVELHKLVTAIPQKKRRVKR